MSVRRRVSVPPGFYGLSMLPVMIPVALTVALAIFASDEWPRNIAPGSGLKLAGLGATGLTALVAWRLAVRRIEDPRAHKFGALLCAVTGMMGWPAWSAGLLPSVNGFSLGEETTVRMTLERTEATRKSKSRDYYHWAWLKADAPGAPVASGRYFIPEATYADWSQRRPRSVEVVVARGVLGAQVITGLR